MRQRVAVASRSESERIEQERIEARRAAPGAAQEQEQEPSSEWRASLTQSILAARQERIEAQEAIEARRVAGAERAALIEQHRAERQEARRAEQEAIEDYWRALSSQEAIEDEPERRGERRSWRAHRGYSAITPASLDCIERAARIVSAADYVTIAPGAIEAGAIERLASIIGNPALEPEVRQEYLSGSKRMASLAYRLCRQSAIDSYRGGSAGPSQNLSSEQRAALARASSVSIEALPSALLALIEDERGSEDRAGAAALSLAIENRGEASETHHPRAGLTRGSAYPRSLSEAEAEALDRYWRSERAEGSIYGSILSEAGLPPARYGEPHSIQQQSDMALIDASRSSAYGVPEQEAPSLALLSLSWSIERSDIERSRREQEAIEALAVAIDAVAMTNHRGANNPAHSKVSMSAVGEAMGIHRGTVKRRILAALALLSPVIEQDGERLDNPARALPIEPASSAYRYSPEQRAARRVGEYPALIGSARSMVSRQEAAQSARQRIEAIATHYWLATRSPEQEAQRIEAGYPMSAEVILASQEQEPERSAAPSEAGGSAERQERASRIEQDRARLIEAASQEPERIEQDRAGAISSLDYSWRYWRASRIEQRQRAERIEARASRQRIEASSEWQRLATEWQER